MMILDLEEITMIEFKLMILENKQSVFCSSLFREIVDKMQTNWKDFYGDKHLELNLTCNSFTYDRNWNVFEVHNVSSLSKYKLPK
ncbi:hypothetical protein CR513_26810, partial [Mucuna pruriens]